VDVVAAFALAERRQKGRVIATTKDIVSWFATPSDHRQATDRSAARGPLSASHSMLKCAERSHMPSLHGVTSAGWRGPDACSGVRSGQPFMKP
jgi:hypothetical protein